MFVKAPDITKSELKRLIAGCVARDRSCQKSIYLAYSPAMMSLCMRYAKSREEAEEVLQDGFLLVYKFIGQFKNSGSFEGWMRKIFINCALQRYRTPAQPVRIVSISEGSFYLTDLPQITNLLSEKEWIRLIQSLPPAYRMVFNLFVFEGLKHRQIATLLNISEGTSKSNLFDARAILKKYLVEEFKIVKVK